MAIKTYKPVTNGRRNMTSLTYEEITTNKQQLTSLLKDIENLSKDLTKSCIVEILTLIHLLNENLLSFSVISLFILNPTTSL